MYISHTLRETAHIPTVVKHLNIKPINKDQ